MKKRISEQIVKIFKQKFNKLLNKLTIKNDLINKVVKSVIQTTTNTYEKIKSEEQKNMAALEKEIRLQQHNVNIILDILNALFTQKTFDDLLNYIIKKTTEVLNSDRASLFLLDEFQGVLYGKVVIGESMIIVPKDSGIVGKVLNSGKVYNCLDPYSDKNFNQDVDKKTGYITKSILAYPLINLDKKVIGVIEAINKFEGKYNNIDEGLIASISTPIAVALERKKAEEQLKQYSEELKEANREIKAKQEELVKASKLAAIGQLVSGIAHELNQPLTSIRGYNEEIQFELKEENLDIELIEYSCRVIKRNVDRCKNIIDHLRDFSRTSELCLTEVDLKDTLTNCFIIFGNQLANHNIKVHTKIDENLPLIWGDSNKLEQVFINLIVNARDSMDKKGRGNLHISLKHIKKKNIIRIAIKDDGEGIAKNVQNRIFEPFFTTKEVGKGTGLGLAILHGIIQEHKGVIYFETEEHIGTTFFIELPVNIKKKDD